MDRIDNRSDGSTDLPTADFDDDGQFGFATRTDGLDIESDGQQYCLVGAVLYHDTAVGFTRTEPLAGPTLAVLVGPLACGGVVVGHVAGDAFLQCGGLQRVYITPDFMGILFLSLRNCGDTDPLELPVPAHHHDAVIVYCEPIQSSVFIFSRRYLFGGCESVVNLSNIQFPHPVAVIITWFDSDFETESSDVASQLSAGGIVDAPIVTISIHQHAQKQLLLSVIQSPNEVGQPFRLATCTA